MSNPWISRYRRAAANVPLAPLRRPAPIWGRLLLIASLCLLGRPVAAVQSPTPDLRVDAYPAGARPFGVDLVGFEPSAFSFYSVRSLTIVVANSGEDSVSIFRVSVPGTAGNLSNQFSLELAATVRGIPSAYGVAACNLTNTGDTALVTSPADNSVVVISVTDGKVLGKVSVGPQPHAVACFSNWGTVSAPAYKGVVSNVGDDSLVVFDVSSLAIEARIPGVAGAKGAHGIYTDPTNSSRRRAWVAGTSADVLTLVDLTTYQVLPRLSVRGPTSVHDGCVASVPGGNVVCYDASLTPQILTSGIPTPADFVSLPYYKLRGQEIFLATGGVSNSVIWWVTNGGVKTLSGIPGAAGLVGYCGGAATPLFFAVTSPDSNRVFLIQPPAPSPAPAQDFSVVNGASFAAGAAVAANSLASLFLTTGAVQNLLANSLPLPKALGGASLRVGGSLAYDSANSRWTYSATGSVEAGLTYVGPSQINFQVPPGISPGDSVPAQLQLPNGKTLLTTLRLVSAAPGIFSILMNGQGQGAVLNQDNSANGDPQRFLGVKLAARGSVIQIFATGAGDTTPALAAGEAAPAGGNPLVLTKVQPTVTIGGKNAKVQFSGMAPGFVGLWQINAEVPADVTPGVALPLVITAAGVASNTVTIAVQ